MIIIYYINLIIITLCYSLNQVNDYNNSYESYVTLFLIGSRATASDNVDEIDEIEPSTRVTGVAHDQSEKQDSRSVQKEEISDSAVNVNKDVTDEEVVSQ